MRLCYDPMGCTRPFGTQLHSNSTLIRPWPIRPSRPSAFYTRRWRKGSICARCPSFRRRGWRRLRVTTIRTIMNKLLPLIVTLVIKTLVSSFGLWTCDSVSCRRLVVVASWWRISKQGHRKFSTDEHNSTSAQRLVWCSLVLGNGCIGEACRTETKIDCATYNSAVGWGRNVSSCQWWFALLSCSFQTFINTKCAWAESNLKDES